jgi:predicted TIM-barrel enzyme
MGFGLEVDMIAKAAAKGHADHALCLRRGQRDGDGRKAGADIIVCHLGLTTGGAIGAETAVTLEQCPALVDHGPRRR